MGKYVDRKDVVRASCRILMNVSHYSGVTNAVGKMRALEKLLECVHTHREAKDVLEATALLFKGTCDCMRMYVRASCDIITLNSHLTSSWRSFVKILSIKLYCTDCMCGDACMA